MVVILGVRIGLPPIGPKAAFLLPSITGVLAVSGTMTVFNSTPTVTTTAAPRQRPPRLLISRLVAFTDCRVVSDSVVSYNDAAPCCS